MSDENRRPDGDDNHPDEVAPSTLFLEMMRRAAAQQSPDDPAPADKTPEARSILDLPVAQEMPPSFNPITGEDSADRVSRDEAHQRPSGRWSISALDLTAPAEYDSTPLESVDEDAFDAPDVSDGNPPPVAATLPAEASPRVPIYKEAEASVDIGSEAEAAQRATALEEQRVRRIKRRRERRHKRRMGMLGGGFSTLLVGFIAAAIASTIFTWFTSPDFIQQEVASGLQIANSTQAAPLAALPTSAVTPNWMQQIGVVSGHRGPENDPGAVCDDGLTEAEINFEVATRVVQGLRALGYTVDLLDEFDPRLTDYQASALVSIHSNDCRDYGEFVSGFLVARAAARPPGGLDDLLAECIGLKYGDSTGLERRYSLTVDMTDYHTFREIHPLTPAAILELGFMKDDRDMLVNEQDLLAGAIVEGVLCYLSGENPMLAQQAAEEQPLPEITAEVGDG